MDEREMVGLLNNPTAAESELLAVIEADDVVSELRDGALNHAALSDEAVDMLLIRVAAPRRHRLLAGLERPSVLGRWSLSLDPEDRAIVAFNPAVPRDCVARLARDSEPGVRANSVFNPGLGLQDVAAMSQADPDADVRHAARLALETSTGWALRQGRRWLDVDDECGQ